MTKFLAKDLKTTNPVTHSVVVEHLGIEVFAQASHDNIFIVRELTDSTEYGNHGLFSIYAYSPHYGHDHMYNVPLKRASDSIGKFDKYITKKWSEYCKLRGIRKNKNWPKVGMTTKVNDKKGNISGFFEHIKNNQI